MIITSPLKLEPNKIYTEKELMSPFEMYGEIYLTYRFMVMREATLDEYRRQIDKDYKNPDEVENREFFYDVSMD